MTRQSACTMSLYFLLLTDYALINTYVYFWMTAAHRHRAWLAGGRGAVLLLGTTTRTTVSDAAAMRERTSGTVAGPRRAGNGALLPARERLVRQVSPGSRLRRSRLHC